MLKRANYKNFDFKMRYFMLAKFFSIVLAYKMPSIPSENKTLNDSAFVYQKLERSIL